MPIPPPPPSAGTPSASVSCKKHQYILHYVFPDGKKELAANADYKVIDLKSGTVISSGRSDKDGLFTDPTCENLPDTVRVYAEFDLDSQ